MYVFLLENKYTFFEIYIYNINALQMYILEDENEII